MKSFDSLNVREKLALVTVAGLGLMGLTGCDISLSNPDMKPQDKAKFEHVLKPAAVKAARMVVKFVKKDEKAQTELSYVSPDDGVKNGYDVQIMGLTTVGPSIDACMKGYKKDGKLTLLPETVYYVEADDTESFGASNDLISQTERGYSGVYRRQVWYAQGFGELDSKGKDAFVATTHVDEPRNEQAINDGLDYAKTVASSFPQEVADYLQQIENTTS